MSLKMQKNQKRKPKVKLKITNLTSPAQSTETPSRHIFLFYWLPVIVWMGLIFYVSDQDSDSTGQNGDIFMFFFNLLNLDPVRMVELNVPLYIRKLAHVVEYFVLFILSQRLVSQYITFSRAIWLSLGITVLYAMSDEFHQTFVPGREGKWSDVGIDSIGAILALIVSLIFMRIKGTKSKNLS